MQFDGYSDLGVAVSIAPQDVTADLDGSSVDLFDFAAATVVVAVGANGTSDGNELEFYLSESDDDSTWAPVADRDLLSPIPTNSGTVASGVFGVLDTGAAAQFLTGYRGNKRYIRVSVNEEGTVGAALVSAVVLRQHPGHGNVNPVQEDL